MPDLGADARRDAPAGGQWARHRPALAHLALLWISYLLAGRFAHGLALIPGVSIIFWPPVGILAATLVLTPRATWPWWIAIGGAAELTCNALWFDNPVPYALVYYAGNAGESLAAAWLVSFRRAKPFRLESLEEAATMVTAACTAPIVSATVIAVTDALRGKHAFTTAWPLVWLGDATGFLVSAPLTVMAVLAWRERARFRSKLVVEAAALAAVLFGACALAFAGQLPTAYLTIPIMLWAAVRFQMRGAVAAVGLVTLVTAAFTTSGIGEFAGSLDEQHEKVVMLQTFLGVSAVSALVVGAIAELYQRVRESEVRFRGVFELAGMGITLLGPDGRIVQCNPAFCTMLGYRSGELLGHRLSDLLHADERRSSFDRMAPHERADTGSLETVSRYVHKDGHAVWALERVSLLRGEPGAPSLAIVLTTDVTEQRAAEEALRDVDRRKTEFLATLAHELRNPLAPIRTAVQLVRLKGAGLPALGKSLDVMDRQIHAMVRLIDDLMDLSRINHGKIQVHRERIELGVAVQRAVEASTPLFDARKHHLSVTLPKAPVLLDADLTRLTQVLSNLLNNAAKYTEPGGRIDVGAEVRGGEVIVSVRDSGIGIGADKLGTVFEMFSQVEGERSRSQGGLGIGLFLVKRLVELHGGTVDVRSEGVGKGSEFRVHLPLAVGEGAPATPSERPPSIAPPGPGLRVVVVDDNRDAAESLAALLRVAGHDVRTAHDGEEAILVAHAHRPKVVVCDLGLPKKDGHEVCRALRAEPWSEGTTFIAASGWGQEADRRRSREAGFDHHLVKPLDPKALLHLLAS